MVWSRAASRWIFRPFALVKPRRVLPSTARPRSEPAAHRPVQRVAVDAGQQAAHCRLRVRQPLGQERIPTGAELIQYMLQGFGDPLADGQERGRSGQHSARCQREYGGDGVPHSARITGIRYLRQALQQAGNFPWRGPGVLTELVKGRRDQR